MKSLIFAKLGTHLPSIGLENGSEVPETIQWMPPGQRTITPFIDGKPSRLEVTVNARTAETMQTLLQDLRAQAASGVGDLPFFDFNHENGRASGHPLEFVWAGEDPVKGGVRAKVQWTDPGKQDILGRAYRRFSPAFYVNAEGEVISAPLNMGGLVNQAAFKNIEAIWSRDAGDQVPNQKEGPIMDPKDKELADLRAALAESQKQLAEVQAKLAQTNNTELVKARDAEITNLRGKIVAFESAEVERVKVEAKSAVADAVAAGKIPPQDKDLQAHYETVYAANPAAGKVILAKLAVPAALQGNIITLANGQKQPAPAMPADVWNAAFKAKEAAGPAAK